MILELFLLKNKKLPQKNENIEKDTLLLNNDEIAKTFNEHWAETVGKLNTFEWPSNNEDVKNETLTNIIKNLKTIQVSSKSNVNVSYKKHCSFSQKNFLSKNS